MKEAIFAFLNRVLQREEINGDGLCPTYLYRWTLLRIGKGFAIYLHKFVGDDWSLDLHDHPKRFWSIGLRGGYIEMAPNPDKWDSLRPLVAHCWSAPWFRTFPADHIHRLVGPTPERPCWTLIITGTPVRQWGFWRGAQWVPWRQYVNSADASTYRSCR